jgi:CRISPR-associated protein Cmr4
MNTRLLFTHALAPLHPGTGQGTGVIDLPIAREKATGLPYLPGSSLKGALRGACTADEPTKKAVFGPETDAAHDHAGSAQLADQRLLLLPVRSLAGTFAWVTSPYVLRRFARDVRDAGIESVPRAPENPSSPQNCAVAEGCKLRVIGDAVYLEDLDLTAKAEALITEWTNWLALRIFPDDQDWRTMLVERFCVVHDDVLGFLLTTATEITARIRLNEKAKTVDKGGLWYEEALPTETVLAGLLLVAPPREAKIGDKKVLDVVMGCAEKPLQLGGKATIGRGLCRVTLAKEG